MVLGAGTAWGEDFDLVTDASQLEDGGEYLIVSIQSSGSYYALSKANSSIRDVKEVTVSGSSITTDVATLSTDAKPFVITLKKSGDKWNLYDAVNKKYLNGGYRSTGKSASNKNNLATSDAVSTSTSGNNGVFTITIANSGVATIKNANSFIIQYNYNNGNSRITTYNNGGQTDVCLYKKRVTLDVTSLSIKSAPTKTRYEVGEALDMSGFVLNVNNGTDVYKDYTMTLGGSAILDGATLSTAGKQTITIWYGDFDVSQDISVGTVTGISVTTPPTKTSYSTGESFDPTGMTVTASLSTGEEVSPDTWTKTVTGYSVSPQDNLLPSDVEVTITYATKTTTQAISVLNVSVTGVSLKSATTIEKNKTETLVPNVLPSNATNTNVTWESDDETVATVSTSGVVTGVAVGTANITVTTDEGGFTATCEVTVVSEKGSIDAPYTVAEVIALNPTSTKDATKTDVYVTGYIVGAFDNGNTYNRTSTSNSQIALADSPNETSSSNVISVEMKSGTTYRSSMNVQDHPYHTGVTKVLVKGDVYKYCGVPGIKSLKEGSTKIAENISISSAGMATWYTDVALDFSELDDMMAYVAKVEESTVKLTRVMKVPANTGILLRNPNGGGATHDVPIISEGAEDVTSDFIGTLINTRVYGAENSYILNNGSEGIGFYKAVTDGGSTVGMHRAYLQFTESVRGFVGFEFEEATGIVNSIEREASSTAFDLQGRRVKELKHGLYIINGKKVLVK